MGVYRKYRYSSFSYRKGGYGEDDVFEETEGRQPEADDRAGSYGDSRHQCRRGDHPFLFQLPFAPYVPETSFNADGKASYRFRFGKEKLNIMRSIDLLVIDEISMVRADLLDAIDNVLRRFRDRTKPFGGVQLLMIGDLQQLSPVVKEDEWQLLGRFYDTPYFFSSHALKQTEYCTIELQKVYRQSDGDFLELLNRIRENRCDKTVLDALNRRYIPDFIRGKRTGTSG